MNEQTRQAAIKAIQKLANPKFAETVELFFAEVLTVDKSARTCKVKTITGQADTVIEDVNLSAEANDGELKIPAIGSTVGITSNPQLDYFVIMFSDLQEWIIQIGTTQIDALSGSVKLGDGSFHGLAKVQEVADRLNLIETDVNNLKTAFSAWSPVPNDGGAALKAAAAAWFSAQLQQTAYTQIENTDITHGTC